MAVAFISAKAVTATVYVQADEAPFLYGWYTIGAKETKINGAWPGKQMTESTTKTNKAGETITFWCQTFDLSGTSSFNIIFNNGLEGVNKVQTGNISDIASDRYFTYIGQTGAYTDITEDFGVEIPDVEIQSVALISELNGWDGLAQLFSEIQKDRKYTFNLSLTDEELNTVEYFYRFKFIVNSSVYLGWDTEGLTRVDSNEWLEEDTSQGGDINFAIDFDKEDMPRDILFTIEFSGGKDIYQGWTFTVAEDTGTSSYILTYMVDGKVYKTYQMAAGSTITPEPDPTKEGYTFSGWSTIPETMPEHDVIVYGTFAKNTTYIPGDVNDDGSVSVTDVGCTINYILEQVPSPFIFEAADMNGDNSVSVTDVGMIINLILSDGASRLEGNGTERNNNNENNVSLSLSLMPVNEGYELKLENKDAYISFQFDVELAEGATISDMRLASADDNDHVLTYRQLDNGNWRVVCYSPSNSTFVSDDTPLLIITVVGNASERYFTGNAGTATLSVAHFNDIRLTTAGLDELRPAALVSMPTGIANVEQGMKMGVQGKTLCITSDRNTTLRLYSLDGCVRKTLQVKKGVNNFDGLRAGIYMIDKQKVILR